jgi:hypothetical protein
MTMGKRKREADENPAFSRIPIGPDASADRTRYTPSAGAGVAPT